jgi:hypothetical protein
VRASPCGPCLWRWRDQMGTQWRTRVRGKQCGGRPRPMSSLACDPVRRRVPRPRRCRCRCRGGAVQLVNTVVSGAPMDRRCVSPLPLGAWSAPDWHDIYVFFIIIFRPPPFFTLSHTTTTTLPFTVVGLGPGFESASSFDCDCDQASCCKPPPRACPTHSFPFHPPQVQPVSAVFPPPPLSHTSTRRRVFLKTHNYERVYKKDIPRALPF